MAKKYFLMVLFLLLFGGLVFFGYEAYWLKRGNMALENNFVKLNIETASTTRALQNKISFLLKELENTKTDRNNFEQAYYNEKNKIDEIMLQVSTMKDMVGVLEQLNKTDKELLKKYSKIYFLNENYIPSEMFRVASEYVYNPGEEKTILLQVWPFLKDLLDAAKENGIDMLVLSAYRSFSAQTDIKTTYLMTYGSGANKFSADQGYSEHQLGTTVDLTTPEIQDSFSGFERSRAYTWLLENAYKYGFVLSYPENNTYFRFEPWHWRFVGKSLAGSLHREGRSFYDMDQRTIDTYLIALFN